MIKKAIVIGCPGSGKSTFSKKLSKITDLPLYHLDMIWHKKDKINVSREEFDNSLKNIMSKNTWIIDGNYARTLEVRIKECDTIFFLDIPTEICLKNVEKRIGTPRDDMPWIEEYFDEDFKKWIIDFPTRELTKIYSLLEHYKNSKNIIIFKSLEEVDAYLLNTNIK